MKAKLYRIFSPHQSLDLYKDLHPEAEEITANAVILNEKKQKWESMPNSAKMLRLGFHGCLPYVYQTYHIFNIKRFFPGRWMLMVMLKQHVMVA